MVTHGVSTICDGDIYLARTAQLTIGDWINIGVEVLAVQAYIFFLKSLHMSNIISIPVVQTQPRKNTLRPDGEI